MPTNRFINVNGGEWNTAANWLLDDDGVTARVPLSTDDVVITASLGASKTITITTTNAVCKSADFSTAGNAFTLSSSKSFLVYGSLTCKTGMTWSLTGSLGVYGGSGTLTSNGVSFSSCSDINIALAVTTVTLADTFTCGTKPLYVYAGASFGTGGNTVTCGVFSDLSQTGAVTLTLGSSTINCTNVSFAAATLTVTANTATINVSPYTETINFGGKTWGGTVTLAILSGGYPTLQGVSTYGNLFISWAGQTNANSLTITDNQTVTGEFKITGSTTITRPIIKSSVYGTSRSITAGTVTITGAVDFRDITGAGAGSWALSAINSGNCGGNSGITFRTPANYYLDFGTQDAEMTYNCWATSSGGGAGGTGVFPLPQDTIIIDNNSWDDTGNTFTIGADFRIGGIDASGLTEANTIVWNNVINEVYGSIDLTGSGVTVTSTSLPNTTLYGRLLAESSSILTIKKPDGAMGSITIIGGTVKFLTDYIAHASSNITLTSGTLDLAGHIMKCFSFSSSNTNTRSLIDSVGGGKIVITGVSSTRFTMATATNLTVSNAPKIDIGTSNLTLTGNVTFAGGGKTFGDFKVTKHAGNFTCDITGANTFGTVTQETPDATYQYAGIRFTAATTTTVAGIVADGTASYQLTRSSITAATHTISDASGTNTVTYNTITNSIATGGATFNALLTAGNVDGGGNTGWLFAAAGPAKLKTWMGVEVAKIKTWNGVPIANIKSINGVV